MLARALGSQQYRRDDVIDHLTSLLANESPRVVQAALASLATLGPSAESMALQPMLLVLRQGLLSCNQELLAHVAIALSRRLRIAPEARRNVLRGRCRFEDARARGAPHDVRGGRIVFRYAPHRGQPPGSLARLAHPQRGGSRRSRTPMCKSFAGSRDSFRRASLKLPGHEPIHRIDGKRGGTILQSA